MSHRGRIVRIMLVLLFSWVCLVSAQSLETLVERYTGDNAGGYVQPLVTAFGANLNSGIYRNAHVPRKGLHLHLALNGMMALFSDDQKTFMASTQGNFNPATSALTSTIVGSGLGASVRGTGGTVFQFPGGYELESFALAAPTLTIGSVAGTEASVRYFSSRINEDIGKLSLLGIGFRHSISQYIHLSPVDIAVGGFYHNFKVGDIIEAKSFIAHAEVSKTLLILDVYGGIAYETSSADIHYTFDLFGETRDILLNVKGKNRTRALVGIGLNLLVFHVNVDYNLGHQNLINAGVSIGL